MSIINSITQAVGITPRGGNVELIRFNIYNKESYVKQVQKMDSSTSGDTSTAKLKPDVSIPLLVNPKEITISQGRITEKVRTLGSIDAANNTRHVIIDWGPDVAMFRIRGQTGSLLPSGSATIRSRSSKLLVPKEYDQDEMLRKMMNTLLPSLNVFNFNTKYSDLLKMSPRHAVVMLLIMVYNTFSADTQIMIMQFMQTQFRGHIENFEYPLNAEKPWNINYSFDFVAVRGLIDYPLSMGIINPDDGKINIDPKVLNWSWDF